jgi:dihydroneopterin aldolase
MGKHMNMDELPWTTVWTIEVKDVETQLRVGIWEHEREYQPIIVSLALRANAPIFPQTIEDCLDYEPICRWLIDELPKRPYTPLLETKLAEVLRFVFEFDSRVTWVDAAMSKPKAIKNVGGAGVRMAISRADYEMTFGSRETQGYGLVGGLRD